MAIYVHLAMWEDYCNIRSYVHIILAIVKIMYTKLGHVSCKISMCLPACACIASIDRPTVCTEMAGLSIYNLATALVDPFLSVFACIGPRYVLKYLGLQYTTWQQHRVILYSRLPVHACCTHPIDIGQSTIMHARYWLLAVACGNALHTY